MDILFLPWITLILLFSAIACWFFKKKTIGVILCLCFIMLSWYGHMFSLGAVIQLFTPQKDECLRVMTWNIDLSDEDNHKTNLIAHEIVNTDPDILFLTEDYNQSALYLDSLLKDHFPYNSYFIIGCAQYIYSKYPIIFEKSGSINLRGDNSFVDSYYIQIKDYNLQLIGCHLSSNNYTPQMDDLRNEYLYSSEGFCTYLRNIDYARQCRADEVDSIIEFNRRFDASVDGCIIMGDMNDISGSSPLRKLEVVGFSDAWWKGGFGYGATIHHPLPYRIDHIMYNDGLKLKSIKKIDANGLSDHDALVAEFEFVE